MSTDAIEKLKRIASPRQRRAMKILEDRGLVFLVHFGTDNAAERLEAMNSAMREERLYQYMEWDLGIIPYAR